MYHIKPAIPVERFRIVTQPLFQKKQRVLIKLTFFDSKIKAIHLNLAIANQSKLIIKVKSPWTFF